MLRLIEGDSLKVLPNLFEAGERFQCCVCDPPYHLTSIAERFGKPGSAPAQFGRDGAFTRASRGFMGKEWDGGDLAFQVDTWRAVYDVMLPGAWLMAFGGDRTYHRLASAINEAGFDIRKTCVWAYGQGMPKDHDISLAIDKHFKASREVVGSRKLTGKARVLKGGNYDGGYEGRELTESYDLTAPSTPEAQQWNGWGTDLKPAIELICMARKPIEGTNAANVLRYGVGGINIDACRIDSGGTHGSAASAGRGSGRETANANGSAFGKGLGGIVSAPHPEGRWPANLLWDGSDEVAAFFPQSTAGNVPVRRGPGGISIDGHKGQNVPNARKLDAGSAGRFFYHPKVSVSERNGLTHPTMKPIEVMRWLVRLVCPPGGTVLDPFAGTGTVGLAAQAEGMDYVGIERDESYAYDARRRLDLPWTLADAMRANNAARARANKDLFQAQLEDI